jgi:probable O-glycosylation ligase (exosortase A-associated)
MGTLRNGRVAPGMHLEDADRPLERGGGRSPQRPQKAWWHPAEEGEGEKDGGAGVAKIAVEPRSESSGAFRALLVFTFILLISPQSIYPPLAKFRIAWLTAAASVGLLLLDRIPRGRPLLAPGRETWAVMALVGWATLTVPFSYWPGGSLSMITDVYSKTLVIFWLLGLTVNTPQRLSRVAWALSLMAIPIAYVGVSNYMSGNFLGGGAGQRIVGYEGALTENPNDLALMLNLIIPLAVGLLSVHRTVGARLVLLVVVFMCIAAIVYTRSRGGFVTLGAVFFFFAWKLIRQGKPGWPAAIVVLALLCVPLLPQGYLARMNTITNIDEDETGSAQDRWESMRAGTAYIVEHPLVGGGIGMNILVLNDLVSVKWHEVHNVYLQYGVDLGLPGLLLFLTVMAASFRSTAFVCRRSDGVPRLGTLFHLSEGLQGSLCAFVVGGFFSPVAYNFYFYYLAGLATGMRQALEVNGVEVEDPASSGERAPQRLTRSSLQRSTSR